MKNVKNAFLTMAVCLFLCATIACSSVVPQMISDDFEKHNVRLIAVMPVDSAEENKKEATAIRESFLEGLYFRNYPKIPISLVDEKILEARERNKAITKNATVKLPQANTTDSIRITRGQYCGEMRSLLGVDAVVYIKLKEAQREVNDFTASYHIDIEITMYSAKTLELIWQTNVLA
ncbi:MAG: hypothetical protein WCJ49_07040, partial [Deltaproteobacteria bacterium]